VYWVSGRVNLATDAKLPYVLVDPHLRYDGTSQRRRALDLLRYLFVNEKVSKMRWRHGA